MRKLYLVPVVVLAALYVAANYVLTLRTPDAKAVAKFAKAGIKLTPHNLSINGSNLHYVSVGADTMPTIVFIHGSPGSWDAFENYLLNGALGSRFRLISIDRPGFGYSNYGRGLNLKDECNIIALFIDSVNNNKPLYLVGHSLGGSIVPVLAADRPNLITGIVILAGAVDPGMEPAESWRKYFIHAPFRYLLPGAIRPSNDELYYFKTDVLNMQQKLAQVKCRVYIIHSVNDELVDVRNVYYMQRNFMNAQVTDTIFTTGNHFIPWNHEAYITKVLMGL